VILKLFLGEILRAVFNASPLIYLGKKRMLHLLKLVFDEVVIPVDVEVEVMQLEESPEAIQLRDAIEEGWMRVLQSSSDEKERIVKLFPEIDVGEASVITLGLDGFGDVLIIDDAEARVAAESFGLRVHGTLYVILEAYRRGFFKSKREVVSVINNMLRKGFYLSTDVYARFISMLDRVD